MKKSKLAEHYPKVASAVGVVLILLLFWLPFLEGMRAAFNRKYPTIPEIYEEWFITLKDFFKIAIGK